ncbi:hypothetical protein H2201_002668 [Coniosporium apollinis]|uniref:Blue (type 1) copper domain-containing protein n=1 Tax=Coniosporium apollinis TaxID=61459 RepID=A0ABQ9P2S7_9PEZI|nr:hypothetical protein H2201_002668 [Coniosporium apollinis]
MYPRALATICVFLAGYAVATTHPGESAKASASATSAAASAYQTYHAVQVGTADGALVFSPDNIKAKIGDVVQFQFRPMSHSVVQSTFDQPCMPIRNVMPNATDAFFSGFMPTNYTGPNGGSEQLIFDVYIADTKPKWFYCSRGRHCQGGMVGVINAPTTGDRTLEKHKELAKAAPQNVTPGQSSAPGSSVSSSARTSVATSLSISSTVAAGAGTATTSLTSATTSRFVPAEQTVNAAPGGMVGAAKRGVVGLGYAGVAALLVL